MQVFPQFCGIGDHPLRGGTEQMIGDLFFDGGLVGGRLVRLEIGSQQPRPERVIWPRPALGVVVLVPDLIEVTALTWWGRIEGFAAAQVNAGDQDVDVYPAVLFVVLDRGQVDVLPIQPGKGQRLEVVQHRADLGGGRGFFGGP